MIPRKPEIRESRPGDLAAIEALYPAAFPGEDLLPLVRALLAGRADVLSLAGLVDGAVAAHGVFTVCGIAGQPDRVALLGPLAVAPGQQQQGLGRAIVEAGLRRLEEAGVVRVFVLGDPAYYGRFGFEADARVAPPYRLPAEWAGAWQSRGLVIDAPAPEGTLVVPAPWRERALWAP